MPKNYGCCGRRRSSSTDSSWTWTGCLSSAAGSVVSCVGSVASAVSTGYQATTKFFGESYEMGLPTINALRAANKAWGFARMGGYYEQMQEYYDCDGSFAHPVCHGNFTSGPPNVIITLDSRTVTDTNNLTPGQFIEAYAGGADSALLNQHAVRGVLAAVGDVVVIAVLDKMVIPIAVVGAVSIGRSIYGCINYFRSDSKIPSEYHGLTDGIHFIDAEHIDLSEVLARSKSGHRLALTNSIPASVPLAARVESVSSTVALWAGVAVSFKILTSYPKLAQEILASLDCEVPSYFGILFLRNADSCLRPNFVKAISAAFSSGVWIDVLAAFVGVLGSGLAIGTIWQILYNTVPAFKQFCDSLDESIKRLYRGSVVELFVSNTTLNLRRLVQISPIFILPALVNGLADMVHTLGAEFCTTDITRILDPSSSPYDLRAWPLPLPPGGHLVFNESGVIRDFPFDDVMALVPNCTMDKLTIGAMAGTFGFEILLYGFIIFLIMLAVLSSLVNVVSSGFSSSAEDRKKEILRNEILASGLDKHAATAASAGKIGFLLGMVGVIGAFSLPRAIALQGSECSIPAYFLLSGSTDDCSDSAILEYTQVFAAWPWLISTMAAGFTFSLTLMISHVRGLEEFFDAQAKVSDEKGVAGVLVVNDSDGKQHLVRCLREGDKVTFIPIGGSTVELLEDCEPAAKAAAVSMSDEGDMLSKQEAGLYDGVGVGAGSGKVLTEGASGGALVHAGKVSHALANGAGRLSRGARDWGRGAAESLRGSAGALSKTGLLRFRAVREEDSGTRPAISFS